MSLSKMSMPLKLSLFFVVAAVLLGSMYVTAKHFRHYGAKKDFKNTGLPEMSYDEALALAQSSNKPLLVDFSAYWCPDCRRFDQNILSDAQVREKILNDYVFVRVDTDEEENEAIVERFRVRTIPTLLVLDTQGELKKKLNHKISPLGFIQQL